MYNIIKHYKDLIKIIQCNQREKIVKLIKDAEAGNKTIGVLSQKDFDTELPAIDDLSAKKI